MSAPDASVCSAERHAALERDRETLVALQVALLGCDCEAGSGCPAHSTSVDREELLSAVRSLQSDSRSLADWETMAVDNLGADACETDGAYNAASSALRSHAALEAVAQAAKVCRDYSAYGGPDYLNWDEHHEALYAALARLEATR